MRRTPGEDIQNYEEPIAEFESVLKQARRISFGFGNRRSGIRPTGAADSADAGHSFFDHAATALRHIGEYTR